MSLHRQLFQKVLSDQNMHPVLVDIGASAGAPTIWNDLAPHAIYVGFDPDLRDLRELSDGRFYRGTIVNKAVTSEKGRDEVQFYFTRSPYCSSTLHPENSALSRYLFASLFDVTGQGCVPATTLDAVVAQLGLTSIDWFKTDSQGTDLRLFNSLNETTRNRVLAVDIEPGLMDAYQGEDLFVDAHRDLVRQGFWLSNIDVRGTQRISQEAMGILLTRKFGFSYKLLQRGIRKSPGWCEARYLRTLDWLKQHNLSRREYMLLWIFALVDNQPGYALDVVLTYEQVFCKDATSEMMQHETTALLQRAILQSLVRPQTAVGFAKRLLPTRIKKQMKWLRKAAYKSGVELGRLHDLWKRIMEMP